MEQVGNKAEGAPHQNLIEQYRQRRHDHSRASNGRLQLKYPAPSKKFPDPLNVFPVNLRRELS